MTPNSRHPILDSFVGMIRNKFNLDADKASEEEVVLNIRRGVEFQGMNLWVLIFATFVASLGLNVNSTAVIIGAMLISPLMGPIMGMGLSVGINDFELLKRSLRNFGFMVLVSILTSTLYFFISPLNGPQSELLARTMPTTYDVLIAFFGGLAGIVAQSRKDRTSTVIPGVAIATALMPPLCTAGYGLATMQFSYFMGAFYLFFINTVFIAIATFIVVRFLKYAPKEFMDKQREQRVRRSILGIVLITIIPSVVIGNRIIRRSIFETNVNKYVSTVFQFPKTKVINHNSTYTLEGSGSILEVYLIGDPISPEMIENARLQLTNYGLQRVQLTIHQNGAGAKFDFTTLQTGYQELLTEKSRRIADLEKQLQRLVTDTLAAKDITAEIHSLLPGLQDVMLSKAVRFGAAGQATDTLVLCVIQVKHANELSETDRQRIEQWLRTRTKTDSLKLYLE